MKLLRWAKEISLYLPSIPQFIIHGNIYDFYPFEREEGIITYDMKTYLAEFLRESENFDLVLVYEPLFGFKVLVGKEEDVKKVGLERLNELSLINAIEKTSEIVNHRDVKGAVIFNFSSRLSEIGQKEVSEFFYRSFRLCFETTPSGIPAKYKPIIFLFEKDTDVPFWYIASNSMVRVISIPKPDVEVRKFIAQNLLQRLPGWEELSNDERKNVLEGYVDQTSGLFGREIISIFRIAVNGGIKAREINEAVRRYKVGIVENPWAKLSRDKLEKAEELIRRRVKGQEKAVRKASGIIRRAFYNLSGAQFSRYSSKPKGILFLAGPTGTGKTELAKTIAELIFGSDSSYIRFDMSEFAQEHTVHRLIGSPPGYVGYEQGGELVNALRQNPFSVVLFDEIEKAHPRLMDIFLQILDDGRITSGRGETVYLSECIIIFTSNLGIYDLSPTGTKILRVSPEDPHEKVEREVILAIEDFFKFKLGRPEILNRIGENIVVFDFIRESSAKEILKKMLSNLTARLWEEHRLKINLSDKAMELIDKYSLEDLSMGGRGIGNKLEEALITPLSNLLFELKPQAEQTILIEDVLKEEYGFRLVGKIA